MITIRLHEVIDSESNAWIYEWFGMDRPFSLETLQEILDSNPGEGLHFDIHCDGGNVTEGLAIYDALRTSGREIECNVEGDCHSMAIVLLLAAPKDRRTSNPNASFLIHEVSGYVQGNTTAVERYAEEMHDLQGRILDIYADRTGRSRDELETIMKEEKIRNASFMLEHGFISSVNSYNTNSNNMTLIERFRNFLSQVESEEGGAPHNVAPASDELNRLNERIAQLEQERDEARNSVATLTAERDQLQEQVTGLNSQLEQARNDHQTELAGVRDQLEQANATIAERDSEINDLRGQLGSHYQPGNRLGGKPAGERQGADKTSEERLNECREKLGWTKKNK